MLTVTMFVTNNYAKKGFDGSSDVLYKTVEKGRNFVNNDLGNFTESVNHSLIDFKSTVLKTMNGIWFL